MAEKDLQENKKAYEALKKKAKIARPKAEELLGAATKVMEAAREFVVKKDLVTIPFEDRATVKETPPFMRTGGFASMDTPGAYETKATEAFYYVTPPETDGSAALRVMPTTTVFGELDGDGCTCTTAAADTAADTDSSPRHAG